MESSKAPVIERRHLTVPEALDIIAQVSHETAITGYSLKEWTRTRDVLVCTDPQGRHIWGVALIHRLFPGWSEIAAIFVLLEHRGKGAGGCYGLDDTPARECRVPDEIVATV